MKVIAKMNFMHANYTFSAGEVYELEDQEMIDRFVKVGYFKIEGKPKEIKKPEQGKTSEIKKEFKPKDKKEIKNPSK